MDPCPSTLPGRVPQSDIMGSLCQPTETGSDTLPVAGFRTMALVALHRLYQRTCRDCGYHWTVTRAQKQKRMRQPVLRQRGVENPREALVATREPVMDSLRECAKCGVFGSPNGQSRSAVQLTPRSNRTYHPTTPRGGHSATPDLRPSHAAWETATVKADERAMSK